MTTPDPFVACALAGEPIDLCPVIDAHGHFGDECADFPILDASLDFVLAAMNRIGIDVFAVSALPAIFNDAARGNRIVEAAIRAHPRRFFGYMCADIGYLDLVMPELERCLAAGFRGVKVYSYSVRPGLPYDHPNYRPIFEFADAHRLPVLAHTWGEELVQLEPIIRRCTHTQFLLAHTGSADTDAYIRLGKSYPNAYLELCFSRSPRGLVERLIDEGLEDKIIWGSDAVFMDWGHQVGRVMFAQVSEAVKRKVLGLNAARALGIEPPVGV